MLSIRLTRFGAKGQPTYRIVVIDKRKARESRAKETIGSYNPRTEPPQVSIDVEKAKLWIKRGAQPSETVKSLLAQAEKRTSKAQPQEPKP